MTLDSEVPPDAAPVSGPLRHISCGGGLTLALHDIGGVLVVGLYGPAGHASANGLQSALKAVFSSQPPRIVIDASCITECDRKALGAFVDAAQRANDSGIPFALSGLARRHVHLLQILWRPNVTASLSHLDLDRALSAVASEFSPNERTRAELLDGVDELHQALSDNRVVEQATGIVMAIYGFPADTAMALLSSHAQAQGEKLSVLAGRLIDSVLRDEPAERPSMRIDALLDDIAENPRAPADAASPPDPQAEESLVRVRAAAPSAGLVN